MWVINLLWKDRLVILAAVYIHTALSLVRTVHYEHQSFSENLDDKSSNIFAISRPSGISCALYCAKAAGCVNFCYSKVTKTCIGCSELCRESNSTDSGTSDNLRCWTVGATSPRDCLDVLSRNQTATDGVYSIKTEAGTKLDVYCIMSKRGGGWTVFLRRFNGEVLFNRRFSEYEAGFGEKAGEHWLGLSYIHEMTSAFPSDFLISSFGGLMLFTEKEAYEEWSTFSIGPGPNYTIHLGSLTYQTYGTVGVSPKALNTAVGIGFSTIDVDRDRAANLSCSEDSGHGGWWYNNCVTGINPTGSYLNPGTFSGESMYNTQFLGKTSMREMTLMFRRTNGYQNAYEESMA